MPQVMLLVKFSGLTWATPKESVLELMRLKMLPWLCSCFRTILCFSCHCFFNNFYPCLAESMTFCIAVSWLAVFYIQISSWVKREWQNLCMGALSQKHYISFCCGLGLSSINMAFLSVMRDWKSPTDFYSLVAEECCMYHGQRERAYTILY